MKHKSKRPLVAVQLLHLCVLALSSFGISAFAIDAPSLTSQAKVSLFQINFEVYSGPSVMEKKGIMSVSYDKPLTLDSGDVQMTMTLSPSGLNGDQMDFTFSKKRDGVPIVLWQTTTQFQGDFSAKSEDFPEYAGSGIDKIYFRVRNPE